MVYVAYQSSNTVNKWLFGQLLHVMRFGAIFPVFFKGLWGCIHRAATVTKLHTSSPFCRSNPQPADATWHVDELQYNGRLLRFQPQVGDQSRNQPTKVRMIEAQGKVGVPVPCTTNTRILLSSFLNNGIQQASAGLRDPDRDLQSIRPNAFLVVLTSVLADTKFTLAIHDTGEIGELSWC